MTEHKFLNNENNVGLTIILLCRFYGTCKEYIITGKIEIRMYELYVDRKKEQILKEEEKIEKK